MPREHVVLETALPGCPFPSNSAVAHQQEKAFFAKSPDNQTISWITDCQGRRVVLPIDDHLVVDVVQAFDPFERFLGHLLEEVAADFAVDRDADGASFEAQVLARQVRLQGQRLEHATVQRMIVGVVCFWVMRCGGVNRDRGVCWSRERRHGDRAGARMLVTSRRAPRAILAPRISAVLARNHRGFRTAREAGLPSPPIVSALVFLLLAKNCRFGQENLLRRAEINEQ